jgi:hypothetical protein
VGITYRSIIDKMSALNASGKVTIARMLELVTSSGCPNLQQLNQMPQTWADIDSKIDLAAAGLL